MTFEIDGFTPLGILGQGGFGTVHRAADDAHGREVAVKVLGRLADDSARRRFDRERRAMGTLSGHPSIGIVYTSGFTTNEEPYIVMEMIRGGSLGDRLDSGGPLPAAEVVELGVALADALDHAHEGGVLHLDLKPENILMSRFGKPKIVDFGIAAIVDDESATSTIRATPAYADPEVLNGSPGTAQSDVYGLAATLFTLLNGSPPYSQGPSGLYRVMQRVAVDPVPRIERSDVSLELIDLLHRAMSKEPAGRPASMKEFEQLLRAVDAGPPTEQRPAIRRVDRSVLPNQPSNDWSGEGERPPLPEALDWSNPVVRPVSDDHIAPLPVADPTPSPPTPRTPTPQHIPPAPQVPPARRSSKGGVVAVLATVAILLAGLLAFILVRRDDSATVTAPDTTTDPTDDTVPVVTVDLAPLITDGSDVPDVVGLSTSDAQQVIDESGLEVAIPARCFDTVDAQSPAAGTAVDSDTVVSLEFPPCVVPEFVGLRLPDARAIVDEEFVVGLLIGWSAHCDDMVLAQSIEPGTVVEPNTEVELTLETDCG